jgi:hypothetical protein
MPRDDAKRQPSNKGGARGPGDRLPGRPVGAWDREFEAENERRRKADLEVTRQMAALTEEQFTKHELVWVTTTVLVCPPCRRAYLKSKLVEGFTVARNEAMEPYYEQAGIFDKMAIVLEGMQRERKEERELKEVEKRAGGFKGKQRPGRR